MNPEVFPQLDCKWGPHPIDRFASHFNAQAPRFNSKFMSPGCSVIDAFSMDWRGENNLLCLPVSLVVDVIKRARECRSVGTLIVPEWPSAFLWPLLKSFPPEFACLVVDVVSLPVRSDLLLTGQVRRSVNRNKPSVFFGCPKFTMLALQVDFKLGTPVFNSRYVLVSSACTAVCFAVVTGLCPYEATFSFVVTIYRHLGRGASLKPVF